MKMIFLKDFPHKNELMLILYDIEVLVSGTELFLDLDIDPQYPYHESTLPYLYCCLVYQLMVKTLRGYEPTNINLYDLVCQDLTQRGYTMAAQYIHVYLSIIYTNLHNPKRAQYHADEVVNIVRESGYLIQLVDYYPLNRDGFDQAVLRINPENYKKIYELKNSANSVLFEIVKNEYTETILPQISLNDIPYIKEVAVGKTNKEIARNLKVAESTVAKHLSELYQKTGTHSKKELSELCVAFLSRYAYTEQ